MVSTSGRINAAMLKLKYSEMSVQIFSWGRENKFTELWYNERHLWRLLQWYVLILFKVFGWKCFIQLALSQLCKESSVNIYTFLNKIYRKFSLFRLLYLSIYNNFFWSFLSVQLINPIQDKTSKNIILPIKINKWKLFKVQNILYLQTAFESAKNFWFIYVIKSLEHQKCSFIMLCKGIGTKYLRKHLCGPHR